MADCVEYRNKVYCYAYQIINPGTLLYNSLCHMDSMAYILFYCVSLSPKTSVDVPGCMRREISF